MSYIDQNLLPGEQILYRTKKHFILFLPSALWTIAAWALWVHDKDLLFFPACIFGIIALGSWLNTFLYYIVSEFAVTTKRVMMREGFFVKHTNETRLSTVANVAVTQNVFGQLLGYGAVIIQSYGGRDDPFIDVAHPFEFKRCLHAQLDKIINRL